jgi:flagellar biosynthesis protein FlhA
VPRSTANRTDFSLDPQAIRDLIQKLTQKLVQPETPVVMITSAGARYFLRQIVEASLPNLFVVSHNEVPPGVKVISLGVLP